MERGAPWARLFCLEGSARIRRQAPQRQVRIRGRRALAMTHCTRYAAPPPSRALVTTAMTAILAVVIASPLLVQQQDPQAEQPQLFSPWTKFCLKGQEAGAKEVCFTGTGSGNDVRLTDPHVFMEQQKRLQEEL